MITHCIVKLQSLFRLKFQLLLIDFGSKDSIIAKNYDFVVVSTKSTERSTIIIFSVPFNTLDPDSLHNVQILILNIWICQLGAVDLNLIMISSVSQVR